MNEESLTEETAKFFVANKSDLRAAIDETGVSDNKFASLTEYNRNTLKRALDGDRIQRAKANGMHHALTDHGWKRKREDIFTPSL